MFPPGDVDFSSRWKAIKIRFVRAVPATERRSSRRVVRGERGVWQRRFWEQAIRDEVDYVRPMDDVHCNPLKHGYVRRVADWLYSTFHRGAEQAFIRLTGMGAMWPRFGPGSWVDGKHSVECLRLLSYVLRAGM